MRRKSDFIDCTMCEVNHCPIAHHCVMEWQQKISAGKVVASYKNNQPIIKGGTIAAGIYIVHSGSVFIILERSGSRRHIIRIAEAGDILEHEFHEEQIKNPFTAEAFGDAVICFIPKKIFTALLKDDTQFTLYLERFYTEKFIKAEERLKNALIMNTQAKIADALLVVADSFNGEIPIMRKELAELIGISADHVSRELKKLMDEEIIHRAEDNKRIVIKDVSKLLEIVREYDADYDAKRKSVK